MRRAFRWSILLLLVASVTQAAPYTVKVAKATPPKELSPAVAQLLNDDAITLLNSKGKKMAQVWLRKSVPAKTAFTGQPTYRDLEETTLLGAVRFAVQMTDYRKQKVKAGVYTLRLGFQPTDGDHQGTAPDPYFCLVVRAADDKDPAPIKTPKSLYDRSGKSIGKTHPGVFLLYPVEHASPAPRIVSKGSGTWALTTAETATAGGKSMPLGIALTLIGHSAAE